MFKAKKTLRDPLQSEKIQSTRNEEWQQDVVSCKSCSCSCKTKCLFIKMNICEDFVQIWFHNGIQQRLHIKICIYEY